MAETRTLANGNIETLIERKGNMEVWTLTTPSASYLAEKVLADAEDSKRRQRVVLQEQLDAIYKDALEALVDKDNGKLNSKKTEKDAIKAQLDALK